VIVQLSFDVDVRVNVFEANIRLLGGLLSAHLIAEHADLGPRLLGGVDYSGGLLDLALGLGRRLLPAFTSSETGRSPADSSCSLLSCLSYLTSQEQNVMECHSYLGRSHSMWTQAMVDVNKQALKRHNGSVLHLY
jgi:hypothetical protein